VKKIPWSYHVKYLGVPQDRKLTFFKHIIEIIKKATQVRGMLYPILNRKSRVPMRIRISLLKMYVIPILTYAGVAWAHSSAKVTFAELRQFKRLV